MHKIPESLYPEIRYALERDPVFDFKREGNYLVEGNCPLCGKRKLFIGLEHPIMVKCNRRNNCGYEAYVDELYPEIFSNLSKRFPPTADNPNAPADAYMRTVRGFDLSKINGMYELGNVKNKYKEEYYKAVRVQINQQTYWSQIIDKEDIRRNDGKDKKIVGAIKGNGWVPPGMSFNEGDEIWITEAIFKSMALLHLDIKSISGLSAGNCPIEIVKANAGKNIRWVVALDSDDAGIDGTVDFLSEIRVAGEKAEAAFPADDEDWDDVLRAGKLTKGYLSDSFYRAFYLFAKAPAWRAFFHYCKTKYTHYVFEFRNALYSYHVDPKEREQEDNELLYPINGNWDAPEARIADAFAAFGRFADVTEICACVPEFLYVEENPDIEDDKTNCFKIRLKSGHADITARIDGPDLQSPSDFSKRLLSITSHVGFEGTSLDLKILKKQWFGKSFKYVRTLKFYGYDPQTQTYVFPRFAYHKSRLIEANKYGYFDAGRISLKTSVSVIKSGMSKEVFDPSWIRDYQKAYDKNGMILLAWWVGTFFAEQIRKQHGSWPFLEYSGAHDSGKTTQIQFLWKCSLHPGAEGQDPNKCTPVALARLLTRTSNLPIVLKEADHGNDKNRGGRFRIATLKDAFNGNAGMREMGVLTHGSETSTLTFRAGLLITQNTEITGLPEELSRLVHCHCTTAHFSDAGREASERLETFSEEKAGTFLHQCLSHENLLLEAFFQNYERFRKSFHERAPMIENRIIKNHAQIAAWVSALPLIFGSGCLPEENIHDLIEFVFSRAQSRQERMKNDPPICQKFWDLYEYLNYKNVNGIPVSILNHSHEADEIAINFNHFEEVSRSHLNMIDIDAVQAAIKSGQRYKYITQKSVRSVILKKPIQCWIFKKYKPEIVNHE